MSEIGGVRVGPANGVRKLSAIAGDDDGRTESVEIVAVVERVLKAPDADHERYWV